MERVRSEGGTGVSERGVRDAYDELCAYTLSSGDPAFIHQHVVDAFAAQRASAESKPIGVTMALVGLYLHVEKGVSGRQVQRTHMQHARRKRGWPASVWEAFSGNRELVASLLREHGVE